MSYASEQGILNAQWNAAIESQVTASEQQRPSVLFKPLLSIDGDQYCVLYGSDLQTGIAGFGESPELAMLDFDKMWKKKIVKKHKQ